MDLKEEEMRRIGVKRKVFSRLNQQGGDESGVSGRSLKDPVSKQDNPGEMHQGDKAHRKRKAVLDGVVGDRQGLESQEGGRILKILLSAHLGLT